MDSQATIRAPRGGQGLDQKELTAMPRWFIRNENWDFGCKPVPAESAAATQDPTAVASEAATAASDQGFSQVSGSDSSSTAPDASAPGASAAHSPRQTAAKRARARTEHLRAVLLPKTKPAPKPEIEGPQSAATVWLNSLLPDPTPPALRLSARFASNLKSAARNGGVNWATMLGILRARGASGHSPADRVTLNRLAAR